jgi:hypothetical protein
MPWIHVRFPFIADMAGLAIGLPSSRMTQTPHIDLAPRKL